VVATWPLHVVSASTPFSGVAFPYGTPSSYPAAIPNLSTFKASADTYGEQTCAQDQDTSNRKIRANNKAHLTPVATCCTYASWFYDGVQVYYNVENMLQNGKNWAQCRTNVKEVYRDKYALPQNGRIQSFMMFSEGYYTDYLITGDGADLTLINDWLTNIYSPTHGGYVDVGYLQREVAYTLRNGIHGVALGQNQTAFHQTSAFMRDYALDHVLGQIDQLCLSQNAQYFENFMIGLQAEALTQYYDLVSHDPRIAPALACVANWQYTNMWQASQTGSFPYDKYQWIMGITEADSGSCMTTLNNLISPMYAWLFKMSGNLTYQIEGDAIFSHGALFDGCKQSGPSGYLTFPFDSNGKTFSQNYYWGPRYVEWRSPPKFGQSQNE
jgi:hypothetical protein